MKSLNRIKILALEQDHVALKTSFDLLKLILKNKDDISLIQSRGIGARFGICTNAKLDRLPKEYVKVIFKSWDEFSGHVEYPIKSLDQNRSHGSYYRHNEEKYKGEYGEARFRLIAHILKKMKKDLKNLNASV